jgi:outer membrane biosynthesis protein TonB
MVPKIDGKQTDVPKTEDIPRTKMFPLRPTAPAAPVQPKPEPVHEVKPELARDVKPNAAEAPKPKTAVAPGDIAMARPEESAPKSQAEAEPPKKRLRRLDDVPAEQRMAALSGEKMKQEGGVRQRAQVSSFDVISSPFGAYDQAVIAAVQERWYTLLDEQGFAGDRTGKVMVRFHLNSDGSVTELKQLENTVEDFTLALICQSAIRDPAPFAPWPTEMRREIGAKYREVTFVFIYR